MLSEQASSIINMLKAGKAENAGKKTTAQSALADRNRIDGIMAGIPIASGIEIVPVSEGAVVGELCYIQGAARKSEQVLLFLHGGGFMNGSVLSRRKLCTDIAQAASRDAFSVEYAQWPEQQHPEGLNDCIRAYEWLLNQGYQPENIVIFGESAGAMLTLTMLLYMKDHQIPMPSKALVFSPVAGQEIDLPSHRELEERDPMISYESVVPYYEGADYKSPYVSPFYGNFEGFPPMSFHVGSEEVLLDDAKVIYNKCIEAGVRASLRVWDGLFHVFPLFDCPETHMAIEEIGDYLK